MLENKSKKHRLNKLLEWIRIYPGWWQLICTPDDEHMNPQIMITLIEQLAKEDFYEIIAVLLMVHRNEQFMKSAFKGVFIDLLASKVRKDKKDILLSKLKKHLE